MPTSLQNPLLPTHYFVWFDPPDEAGDEALHFVSERQSLKLKGRAFREFHQRVIGDADDAFARIATERAKCVELFEKDIFEAGFFFEFAPGGIVEGFIDSHKAARQGPFAFEGLEAPLDEENLEFFIVEAENDAIDSERRPRIFVSVRHSVVFTRS